MMSYQYIRAYAAVHGVGPRALQYVLEKARNEEKPETVVWWYQGHGWIANLDDVQNRTIREEIQDWVTERGGRSDEFVFLRDLYGATEVEQTVDWRHHLCDRYGWDDPSSIIWAAATRSGSGQMSREIVVLQLPDGDCHTYFVSIDGDQTVVSAPQVIA